jgi:hypothetical protein
MNSRLLSQLFLLLSVLSFLSVTSISPAQTPTPNFTLTTIQESGPRANSYNIVFLPDGYTKDELPKFQSDTQKCVNTFFNQPVFKEYQTYFNIYRIDVPSNQSGSDHPELNTTRDTYFNSTYNFNNRPRMIYTDAVGATRIYDTAAQYVPEYDQIIVIVNDSTYGGTGGGGLSFICNGPDAPEILMHELGHAIGQQQRRHRSPERRQLHPSQHQNHNSLDELDFPINPNSHGGEQPRKPGSPYRTLCKHRRLFRMVPPNRRFAHALPLPALRSRERRGPHFKDL